MLFGDSNAAPANAAGTLRGVLPSARPSTTMFRRSSKAKAVSGGALMQGRAPAQARPFHRDMSLTVFYQRARTSLAPCQNPCTNRCFLLKLLARCSGCDAFCRPISLSFAPLPSRRRACASSLAAYRRPTETSQRKGPSHQVPRSRWRLSHFPPPSR